MKKPPHTKAAKVTKVVDELAAHDAIKDPFAAWRFRESLSDRARAVLNAAGSTASEFRGYLDHVDDRDLLILRDRIAPQRETKVKTKLIAARIERAGGLQG